MVEIRFSRPIEKGINAVANTCDKTKKLISAIKAEIRDDIDAVKQRDPAARNDIEILLLYSGVHAILAYRVAHKLYLSKHYFSARAISQAARHFTGIEIHPGATIGKSFFIDHGMGVVIGETTEIGDNCTLYQGVTLGGTGKDVGKRHPTLGNNVMVGAGAKVLGPFKVADNSKIAANAVVLNEIPENSTAVGIPAKVVRRSGMRIDDLDQIHIPDPVAQEISKLEARIDELTVELGNLKVEKPEAQKSGGSAKTAPKVAVATKVTATATIKGAGAPKSSKTQNNRQAIIEYLENNGSVKSAEISELLGLKPTRAKELLAQMASEGIIIAEGGNKNRTYKLK